MPSLSSRSRPSATPLRERRPDQNPEAFEYESPVAPLNEEAQQALDALLQAHSTRRLMDHVENLTKIVTDVAGQVNDAGSDAKENYAKKRARIEANGEEPNEDDLRQLETLTGRIDGLTQRLDKTMREIVDSNIFVSALPGIVDEVKNGAAGTSTQLTTTTFAQSQRRTRARVIEDEEDEIDSELGEVGHADIDGMGTQPTAPSPDSAPSAVFKKAVTAQNDVWNSKTLTSRYSTADQYVGFYKTVHDAKNPGDNAPPLPHASTWFLAEEDPESSVLEDPQGEDEDLEVMAERISGRCPITTEYFRNPVTSTKCGHSFEHYAILQMMKPPAPSRSQRSQTQSLVKTTPCPVCDVPLTANDLRADPALLRKAKRLEAAEIKAREENSDDEDDDAPRGTQQRAHRIGSSPAGTARSRVQQVKQERISKTPRASSTISDAVHTIPDTQVTRGSDMTEDTSNEEDVED
ncbi:putative chromosomal organization and dna repair protein [Phaeomoniella chlamydospora]|uniref:Putative chromosomal organization and dna repair protein n=1 Tax=Phaeomoniella chlamydospora TaxID=158046 RepID=A0A0G2G9Y1_PHACM|nr:putative chromosomal organization and dna repair protein [Phaeomoniella chlamydospora]